jgi:multidrug efflux pump subunit AcrA (membrane-fusion protein)
VQPAAHLDVLTLPAEVVGAPDYRYTPSPPLAGMIQSVHVALGERVAVGTVIADMRIPSLESWQALSQALSNRLKSLESLVEMARERHTLGVGTLAEVADAEARVSEARLALTQWRKDRTNAEKSGLADGGAGGSWRWRAQREGIITRLQLSEGLFVAVEEHPVEIIDVSAVEVRARVPERHLARLGDDAMLLWQPVGFPDDQQPLLLKWRRREAIVDPTSRTVACFFALPEAVADMALWLAPGRSGRATIRLTADAGWWAVPDKALIRFEGRNAVLVRDRELPRVVPVQLIGRGGDNVVVRGALNPGDEVVTRGTFLVKSHLLLNDE